MLNCPPMRARRIVSLVLLGALVGALCVAFAVVPAPRPAGAQANDDMIYAFGSATFLGSTQNLPLAQPIVAMAQTRDGSGYWLVADDGGVFAYNAPFFGALAGWPLRLPVSGMAATPDGGGYWIVTEDGAVFPFGSAQNYGNLTNLRLVAPITDIIPTPDSHGYWLVAEDGGVFSFGSAQFYGSTGGMRLNAPVVSMAAVPSGAGYWLIAKDGGVFSFGSAQFQGSTANLKLVAPVVGMTPTGTSNGYTLVAEDGGVFNFGDSQFQGSAAGQLKPGRRAVQVVGMPHGDGYRILALARPPDVSLVGPGMTGAGVTDLQNRLEALGFWTGGVTGSYGPLTQQAVWAFQKANGIGRTGVVDPTTRVAFRNARRVVPQSTSGYVIEVDKARQIVIIARDGRAQYVLNTSTGTEKPYTFEGKQYLADTPPGHWHVFSAVDGYKTGPLGTLYRPRYFHPDGIAFHGYPNVPPTPASHGCVRLSNAAINWVWDNNVIPIGTEVWVY